MKCQIRLRSWETNSSSAHSLLIMKKRQVMTQKEIREEYYLDEDWNKDRSNILQLDRDCEEYGRGFNVLTSFRDKLSYALASMCGSCYSRQSRPHSRWVCAHFRRLYMDGNDICYTCRI